MAFLLALIVAKKICRIGGFAKETMDLPSICTRARDSTKPGKKGTGDASWRALLSLFLKAFLGTKIGKVCKDGQI